MSSNTLGESLEGEAGRRVQAGWSRWRDLGTEGLEAGERPVMFCRLETVVLTKRHGGGAGGG